MSIGALLILGLHLLGALTALEALSLARSPQAAIAWSLSLVEFPYIALPLYWVFGRSHFRGYRILVRRFMDLQAKGVRAVREALEAYRLRPAILPAAFTAAIEQLADGPFCGGNTVQLLIDGAATYAAIFSALEHAHRTIEIEYYIVRDDHVGHELQRRLIERASAGVAVRFLYDEIGSLDLSPRFLGELRAAGCQVAPFATRQGRGNFFQFNFRNHRKIVVVDGQTAFVGGLNVGDEYLGRIAEIGRWRDTHLELCGPVVLQVQGVFLADWAWATQSPPLIPAPAVAAVGTTPVLILSSGPADTLPRALQFFLQLIESAQHRLWIASPYFVPEEAISQALLGAVLRGVDVRLLVPRNPDHFFVGLASLSFLAELAAHGVRVFSYVHGFLHNKVSLVDDQLATVGTVNFDNRSFHLNFELTAAVADREFVNQVAGMLDRDFADSVELSVADLVQVPWKVRLGAKVARLSAPLL